MIATLEDRIANINNETSLRCILLDSSYPQVFSAGADLKERSNMNIEETQRIVGRLQSVFDAFSKISVPTIAIIEGAALGGGAELALACDIRIGGYEAKLAFPETRLGIIPGAGGTQRLTRLIGTSKAKEIIFTGRHIAADECASLGLLNQLSEDPMKDAIQMAEKICKGGPIAIKQAKYAIDAGYGLPIHSALAIESRCYEATIKTEDRLEGLRAFKTKTEPIFKGK